MRKIISICLCIIIIFSLCFSVLAQNDEDFKKDQAIELSKEMILEFIYARETEYYNLKSVDFEISEQEVLDTGFSFDISATIMHELKATSVEELPYVQGMMCALSAEESTIQSQKIGKAAFEEIVGEIENYIGEPTRICFYFNVIVDAKGSVVKEEHIQLYALDSTGNNVSITDLYTPSHEEMFFLGHQNIQRTMMDYSKFSQSVSRARGATLISNYDSYDRIAARDYAYEWYGPNDSDYNPSYSNWNSSGGDCANFVSQCIQAGGVPTSSEWKKDTTAWVSTSTLAGYMVNNGYATAESYLDTTAGNFATKIGHAVLVTLNNTVDVCYSAHNANRKDAAFTNTELSSTYTFYVIKNY